MPKHPTPPQLTEVVADPANDRRQRRTFSTDEKLRILTEADRCTGRGEMGALLRREGVYSSLLTTWRKQLRAGGQGALAAKKPGRKPSKSESDLRV